LKLLYKQVNTIGYKKSLSILGLYARDRIYEFFGGKIIKIVREKVGETKYYTLEYEYHSEVYKIRWKTTGLLSKVLIIEDEKGEIINDSIMPFLGFDGMCHGTTLTPSLLGYEKLVFTDIMGGSKEFLENDIIS
jgi:hypothetical protein